MVVGPLIPDPRTYAEVAATGRADTGDRVSSDRGNTTALSPTCQHASGQGRADRRGELPCDDTVTQAARLASAEGNHASDDRCLSPRRCPSPRETRAETDKQPGHRGSDRGRETSVPNSGVSLIGQPGQGAERGDVMALHRDVTGLASGSQIGKPPRGGGSSGAGVSPRHDVASRDVAVQSTSARGGRRVSTGRQTELRAYLGNPSGSGGSDRPRRKTKAK
ncbi:hypothetical protein ACOMHN_027385 [Nucella lapillus]